MTGQMSLFSGLLRETCDTKPEIGSRLIFHYKGLDYPCKVAKHCGWDFFWIEFTGRNPSADDVNVCDSGGWHISLKGYGKDWNFA